MSQTEPLQVLSFRIGSMLFCVPVEQVETIVEVPRLTSLPLLPKFALGVFQYRNEVAAVIDLGVLLEVPREGEATKPCLIMSRIQQQAAGFLVDTVLDLLDTTQYAWTTVPVVHAGQQVERALVRGDEMFLLLNFGDMDELHRMMQDVKQGRTSPRVSDVEEVSINTEPECEVTVEHPTVTSASIDEIPADIAPPSTVPIESDTTMSGVATLQAEDVFDTPVLEVGEDKIAQAATSIADAELDLSEAEYQELVCAVNTDDPVDEEPVTISSVVDSLHEIHTTLGSEESGEMSVTDVGSTDDQTDMPAHITAAVARDLNSDFVVSEVVSSDVDEDHLDPMVGMLVSSHSGHLIQTSSTRRPLITRAEPKPAGSHKKMFALGIFASILVLGLMWWGLQVIKQLGANKVGSDTGTTGAQTNTIQQITPTLTQDSEIKIIEKKNGPERLVVELPGHEMRVIRAESVDKTHPLQAASPGEIIHTVVRGDTLWDIARKYLKNPFRYPELAKNSAIHNPNLIYPGDVVRITRRTHGAPTK